MDNTEIQMMINAAGFGPVVVDGNLGPRSKEALKRFQQAFGLMPDGIPGPKTQAKLTEIKEKREQIGTPAPTIVEPVPQGRVLLTAAVIKAVAPKARGDIVSAIVNGADKIAKAGIVTPLLAAHFLTQGCTETGGLQKIEENLNYSSAGLRVTFGPHRISDEDCKRYGRTPQHPANPEMIANIVYGGEWGRKNLGNTEPGDGWLYRGGGILQNTGRANYAKAGYENNPDALRHPPTALEAALEYWVRRNINAAAARDDLREVRRLVNGGSHGLDDAQAYLAKAKRALGV